MTKIVLVNEEDENIGECEKLETHRKGYLHRAFSIFIFNKNGDLLLQKRADHKYHSPGLWSNTCCSHDIVGMDFEKYINVRLFDEVGIKAPLNFLFKTIYKLDCTNNLIEHEFNHVYLGITEDSPIINPDEVSEWRYISKESLLEELAIVPENFTEWFKFLLPTVLKKLSSSGITIPVK